MSKKPFDPQLFEQTDAPARQAVSQYIAESGLYVRENPDKYGPDLILYKGFKPWAYVEVEVKLVWRADQDTFPWTTIHLPSRKTKFLNLGLPIEYFILRSDLRKAVILPDYVVAGSSQKEVSNVYVASGEVFCNVEVAECQVVDIVTEE